MPSNYTNVSAPSQLSFTNNSFLVTDDSLSTKIPKTVAYCLLFAVSLTGNVLIIWAIHKDTRLKTTTNILIANVAVSDLLVPFFVIIEELLDICLPETKWMINGNFGIALCKLVHFFQDVSMFVSIYSCIFIAIDRYYAVARPLKGGFSKRRLKYIIPGVWLFAATIASPDFSKFNLTRKGTSLTCAEVWPVESQRIQMFIFFALLNGIPIPVITVLYVLMVVTLRKRKVPGQTANSATIAIREHQNRKVLKLSVVIIALLFCSWLMLDVVLFLGLLGHLDAISYTVVTDLVFSVKFVAFLSCAYNFFIYLVFSTIYRENFKRILHAACCSKCG